ncbi:hypothetical protein ABFY09_14230 [Marinomonas sp. 5E14-1]|uniref:COG4648 family protein n=1 Tax=Marinomonas sp. 5E14-1 TaxID=3153922 RepID=UPI0032678A75
MVILKIFLVIVTIMYPFLVYFGLTHFDSTFVLFFIITLLMIKGLTERRKHTRKIIFVAVVGMVVIAYFWGNQQGLKFYPVLVNAAMLLVFASSLYSGQPIIERIARLKEPDLPETGVSYTRKVTVVWCAFFTLNGFIALFTALWASDEAWLFYNGFFAYVLIGLLVTTEWIIRHRVKNKA